MPKTFYYVCDRCGCQTSGDVVPEDGEWTCPDCGSHTAWEFTSHSSAYSHSAYIQRAGKSRIFRHA
jgi:DNA-directed RNA polymerase subunit RPC12/RpoP